tara:strand:- start:7740 stop:9755 length:2016 start_codon:yes stop_codon:yes gene_type:complete
MGLERMTATLMGTHDNYAIDIMRGLIENVADLTGVSPDGDMSASHRVIADHIRCSAFLMADGVMPSNEGRGYVLRRIMRRGMRHAHLLGASDPLMYKLLPNLIGTMGDAYPELVRAQSMISQTLETEEIRFKKTLDRGLRILEEEAQKVGAGAKFPGDVAFKLYDTFGFPLDLTQDALKSDGIEVDIQAFNAAMDAQREAARAAWSGSGDSVNEKIWFDLLEQAGSTEFLGYDKESAEGKVLAIIKDDALVESLRQGEEGIVITNQTPFYAESGGQVGDTGRFVSDDTLANVTDTKKKLGKLWAHIVRLEKGDLKKGQAVQMHVDHDRRSAIRANHSVTHLLHEALRRTLGDHVSQKGSLQDADRTRFDISHPNAISADDLMTIEQIVNDEIAANTPVVTRVMALEDARESGAMALFGEKYDDEVRVVAMGSVGSSPFFEGEKEFSVELCGGTHVKNTGEIEKFKIVSEGALSAGIRRVEAVTGARVDAYLKEKEQAVEAEIQRLSKEYHKLCEELKALGGDVTEEVSIPDPDAIRRENKKLQKQIGDLRRKSGTEGSEDNIKDLGGTKFVGKVLDGFPPKDLKPMADELKKKLGSGVVALVATNDGKASIVVGVTADLTNKISAVDLVKIGSEALGGKGGGGRPDMAQAGGPNADAANDGVQAIETALMQ